MLPPRHHLAPGTQTVVLVQVRQLRNALADPHDTRGLSARALGIAGESVRLVPVSWDAHVVHDDARELPLLPDRAVLRELRVEGSPEFPYVWGRFAPVPFAAPPGTHPWLEAVLRAETLRRVSRCLGFTHRWELDT